MAKYLLEINYTLDGVKGLIAKGGSARQAAAQAAAESVGGNVESFHFAFGGTDAYVIADLPDNISAAALALAVTAGGGATTNMVVLLTTAEIVPPPPRQSDTALPVPRRRPELNRRCAIAREPRAIAAQRRAKEGTPRVSVGRRRGLEGGKPCC